MCSRSTRRGPAPRFSYSRAVHHVTLRCNNREFLFAEPWLAPFAELLQEARARFPIRLLDYCAMTNHVHLLFQVGHADTPPKVMHWLSTSFVRRFNKATARRGHLWEGRYRSTIIEQATYFLRCMAYVDLNPVRAGMVEANGTIETPLHLDLCPYQMPSAGGGRSCHTAPPSKQEAPRYGSRVAKSLWR